MMARERDYATIRHEIDEAMKRVREAQEDAYSHRRAIDQHEMALKTLQKQEQYLKDRGDVPVELDQQMHAHLQECVAHAGPLAESQERLQRAGEDLTHLQDEMSAIGPPAGAQPGSSQEYGYGITAMQRFQDGARQWMKSNR